MNDTDFQKKVLSLCEEALSYESSERGAFLESVCAGDEDLRESVDKLMRTVGQTTDFLNPVSEEPAYSAGDMIGEYRIVSSLGRGGMGSVYMAEREAAGYTQRVAIKVMRTHVQSTDMMKRFDEERRILARLHHPYIAHLLDGGTTEKGLPYLVTELVEGTPIDQYCDERSLTLHDRLELVQKVALAIQSAHQNLVVHSDLKPSNILVTEDGIPKLLDFGIARLIRSSSSELPDDDDQASMLAMTPDYASPEQIAGDAVTTISDVYSLGVLTYTLLVGETPYVLKAAPRDEMMRQLERATVQSPSSHMMSLRDSGNQGRIGQNRHSTVSALSRQLSGDLDAVLTKVLSREPQDRYPSALIFATELKHFCEGMPVSARADTPYYRLRKFVGRHRFSVAAGCAGILALVGGLAISMWQAHIAEQRFKDLRGFAETVMFDLHDEIADLPGGTSARQLMTRESLHYLDRLAQDAGGDADLQLDLSKAYQRLGDVLGNPTNANLGDVNSAIESYTKALDISEQLSSGVDDDAGVERHKALVHEKMADVLTWNGDLDRALSHSLRSGEIFESLVGVWPDTVAAEMAVAISRVKRGDLLGHPSFPNAGRTADALNSYQQALATISPLAAKPDSSDRVQRYHALILERVGTMLSEVGQFDDALEYFRTSLGVRELRATNSPGNANAKRDVAIAYEKIGDVRLARGNAEGSLEYYRQALGMYRELAAADPDNANAVRTLAIGLENLSDALLANGQKEEAREYFVEIIKVREGLVANNPDNERFVSELEEIVRRAGTL